MATPCASTARSGWRRVERQTGLPLGPHFAEELRMIFITVKHQVRRKFADDWPTLVADFTTATRAEEGNLWFEWYRGVDDPNVYVLIEAFRDSAAGEAHVNSTHFKTAAGQLGQWLADVPEVVHVE